MVIEISQKRNWGLWAAGVIAILVIVLARMWWRGDLRGTAVDAPVPAPAAPATGTSPAPATTPAPAGQH